MATSFTTSQVTTLIDNITQSLLDIESSEITTSSTTLANIVAGNTGSTTSLLTHLAALTQDADDTVLMQVGNKTATTMAAAATLSSAGFYPIYLPFLLQLERDLVGISEFLRANSLLVHPEFANLVNSFSTVQPGVPNPLAPILPASIMVASETQLAKITVTGSSAGTFANVATGGTLSTNSFSTAQPLYLKNITGTTSTGTATAFTITYTNAAGNASASKVYTLSGAMANNATASLSITGYAVSAITVTSGGTSDVFAVAAEPIRTVQY
jgi:hypothetical protein